jgi:hypothetical protein
MTRTILPLLAALAMLAACGDATPGDDNAATGRDGSRALASASDATPQAPQAKDFEPIDPKMGGLTLAAVGPHAGEWTFKDVNGSIREITGGGETSTMLQLEAHNDPVHFKLRLSSADGELRPGRYRIGDGNRKLDATYENAGVYYTAAGSGSAGDVELTTISDDRAVGTFDLTLETLSQPATTSKVKGTFDMVVQR